MRARARERNARTDEDARTGRRDGARGVGEELESSRSIQSPIGGTPVVAGEMRASARSRRSASTGAIDADAGLARREGDAGGREVMGSAMTRSMAARASERKSSAAKESGEDEGVRFRDGVSAVEWRGNRLKRALSIHA